MNRVSVVALLINCAVAAASAADWPWWRGPNCNGSAAPGPVLADAWGPAGPTLLWKSEPVKGGFDGGMGSVTVADGKAYFYANWTEKVATPARKVTEDVMARLGRLPKHLPAAQAKAVEEARLSDERASTSASSLRAWLDEWLAKNLSPEQKTEFGEEIKSRLMQGKLGLLVEQLTRLGTIVDREFPSVQELRKWLTENGFTEPVAARIISSLPTGLNVGKDAILCLDAATGKTIWRKDYPGWSYAYAQSPTITIAAGRAYVAGSYRSLYCLDAATGKLIWSGMTEEQPCRISSSVLVVDDLAILLSGQLTAYNIETGEQVWHNPKITGRDNSPVLWSKDSRKCVLINTTQEGNGPGTTFCVDPKTGKTLWTVPGGGFSTTALVKAPSRNSSRLGDLGDVMVVMGGSLTAYQLEGDKPPTKLWSARGGDRGASPVICNDLVIAIGNGKAVCVDLVTGQTAWTEKVPESSNTSSPSAADGKVFYNAEEGKSFIMFQAAADKYNLLAKSTTLGAVPCSSPTIVDGKCYLRLKDGVGCFDLISPPPATAPAAGSP